MLYIVTGGAGFIGSHLIEDLLANDHQVICVDDLSTGYLSNLPSSNSITVIIKSIQDIEVGELP